MFLVNKYLCNFREGDKTVKMMMIQEYRNTIGE